MFGACPTSYSACVSEDVGSAPEPSQSGPDPMVDEPTTPSPEELDEVAHQVEQEFLVSKCMGEIGTPEADYPQEERGMITVEEDLQLSCDSESSSPMSDNGESAPEPPPRDPPNGDDWFEFGGGNMEPTLKRSASGEVCDGVVQHKGTATPSPRYKKCKPQSPDSNV